MGRAVIWSMVKVPSVRNSRLATELMADQPRP